RRLVRFPAGGRLLRRPRRDANQDRVRVVALARRPVRRRARRRADDRAIRRVPARELSRVSVPRAQGRLPLAPARGSPGDPARARASRGQATRFFLNTVLISASVISGKPKPSTYIPTLVLAATTPAETV